MPSGTVTITAIIGAALRRRGTPDAVGKDRSIAPAEKEWAHGMATAIAMVMTTQSDSLKRLLTPASR